VPAERWTLIVTRCEFEITSNANVWHISFSNVSWHENCGDSAVAHIVGHKWSISSYFADFRLTLVSGASIGRTG